MMRPTSSASSSFTALEVAVFTALQAAIDARDAAVAALQAAVAERDAAVAERDAAVAALQAAVDARDAAVAERDAALEIVPEDDVITNRVTRLYTDTDDEYDEQM